MNLLNINVCYLELIFFFLNEGGSGRTTLLFYIIVGADAFTKRSSKEKEHTILATIL
jgi:hypothetical protein